MRGLILLALLLGADPVAAGTPGGGPVIESGPSGLTVVVEEMPNARTEVLQVWVRAGSVDEEEETLGLSHYLEHMLFKGTEARGVGEIHSRIEALGGDMNAATSSDYTFFYIEVPPPAWEEALEILSDAIQHPSFPPDEVERERTVILEELHRRNDSPATYLLDRIDELAYTRHPYRMRTIGSEDSINGITREDLVEYHRRWYVGENMAFVAAGPATSEEVIRAAEEAFAGVGDDPPPRRHYAREPRREEPEVVEEEREAAQVYLAVSFPAPASSDEDANADLDLLSIILAGGRASRLNRILVDDMRVARSVSVSYPTARYPSRFTVTAVTSTADMALVRDVIEREVRRIREEPVGFDELARARTMIETERAFSMEDPSSRASLWGFWFIEGEVEDGERYMELVRESTPDSVRRTARRYLDPAGAVSLILRPPRTAAGEGGERILDNGMTLILRPDTSSPVVALNLFADGGQRTEPSPGEAALLAGVLTRGSAGREREETAEIWESNGLEISASSAPDYILVSATAIPRHLGLALREVRDIVTAPNLDEGEISAVRDEMLRSLSSRRDSPFSYGYDSLRAAVHGEDPYGRPEEGNPESLSEMTREDLARYSREAFAPSRLVLVATGNFDPDAVIEGAGGWAFPASEAGTTDEETGEDTDEAGPRPLFGRSSHLDADTSISLIRPGEQLLILRGYPAPPAADDDYPAMKVLNEILGGRSSSRLFSTIRERDGLAYSVGSFYPTRRDESLLVLYAGTSPGAAAAVSEAFGREIDALAHDLTEEELEEAKASLIGAFERDHGEAARRGWYLGWYEVLDLGADFDEDYAVRIRAVELEEIRGLVERWLISAPHAEVRVGPEED